MNHIIISIIVMTFLGLIFALILAWASKKFSKETESKIKEIIQLLPLENCGKCGYPGCGAYAKSIAEGKTHPDLCPSLEKEKAEKIKEILAK